MNRQEFCIEAVRTAGAELMRLRGGLVDVTVKDGDPRNIVTDADVRLNTMLSDAIRNAYPSEAIYSEEASEALSKTGRQWVIDPIDGTANFSRGIPHFAVCLGVIDDGVPTAGAVFNPITNELFSFARGEGAFLNGAHIAVSSRTNLKEAAVLFRAGRDEKLAEWGGKSYTKLLKNAWKTNGFGSASLDTCFVAAGRVEASIYGTFGTADSAPALGILTEAGGIVMTPEGSPPSLKAEAQTVIAANNRVLGEAVRSLLFT